MSLISLVPLLICLLFLCIIHIQCFGRIKHYRDIDADNAMHIGFWLTSLPLTQAAALINFVKASLRHIYNQYQIIGRLKRKIKFYKKILIQYGLFKLSTGIKFIDNKPVIDNVRILSPESLKTRAKSFVDLLITQDASISIAQDFLMLFVSKLYEKSDNVQEHLRQKMLPIIIRDINTSIQGWRMDPNRQIREAFGHKDINMSVRKARKTRANV